MIKSISTEDPDEPDVTPDIFDKNNGLEKNCWITEALKTYDEESELTVNQHNQ